MVFSGPFLAHPSKRKVSAESTNPTSNPGPLLAAAVDRLSTTSRLVLCLLYFEGLSLAEAAAVLSLNCLEIAQLHDAAMIRLYTLTEHPSGGRN